MTTKIDENKKIYWYAHSHRRDPGISPINHLQGDGKTVCGISYGPYWGYGYTLQAINIHCKRCRRIAKMDIE